MEVNDVPYSISVVVTVHNDYFYLEQALSSVLNQSFLPDQIIVVDDGSAENQAQVISERFINESKGVEIVFLRKENGGASSARNYGILFAKGDYVAFLDVDDRMLPNNLFDKHCVIQEVDEDYFGVYGGAVTSDGNTQEFASFDGSVDISLIDVEVRGIPGGAPFYLFRKSAIVDIGGFDEDVKCNEDYDILIRLLRSGKKCKSVGTTGYYRNMRSNSLSRPSDPNKHFSRIMSFLDKAERLNYYSKEHLNSRRMEVHLFLVKGLLFEGKVAEALLCARKGFKYSRPVTPKQKIVYWLSLSFL